MCLHVFATYCKYCEIGSKHCNVIINFVMFHKNPIRQRCILAPLNHLVCIVDWVSVYIATYVHTPIVSIQSQIEKQLSHSLKTNNQYSKNNTYVASIIWGEDMMFSLLTNNRSKG